MEDKCLKIFLITFNVMCMMGGIAMFAGGILIVYQPSTSAALAILAGSASSSTTLGTLGYLMVALGGLIVFVSFMGCCGAMSESKCMIGLYFIFILLLFIGQIVLGVLGVVYGKEGTRSVLEEGLTEYAQSYKLNSQTLDTLQETFMCCGVNGTDIYTNQKPTPVVLSTTAPIQTTILSNVTIGATTVKATVKATTVKPTTMGPTTVAYTAVAVKESNNQTTRPAVITQEAETQSVDVLWWPDSCCKRDTTGIVDVNQCHNYNQKNDTILSEYVYTKGCVDSLTEFVESNLIIIGGCALALAFVEIIVMAAACKLHRSLD